MFEGVLIKNNSFKFIIAVLYISNDYIVWSFFIKTVDNNNFVKLKREILFLRIMKENCDLF